MSEYTLILYLSTLIVVNIQFFVGSRLNPQLIIELSGGFPYECSGLCCIGQDIYKRKMKVARNEK